MVNILLSGCGGTMGQAITKSVANRDTCAIIAGIDPTLPQNIVYPVFASASDISVDIRPDVIIDFSHPSALSSILDYALENSIPIVEATTGLSTEQIGTLQDASSKIPVFFTANMSLGVNLMVSLLKKATQVLSADFDIEIIEKHHNKKIDAPSGTALMLADTIAKEINPRPEYIYDRHPKREKRSKNEIGIHAVRGGTIVGEHEVIFAGQDEIITISHSAASKEVFATGSINAAIFLSKQKSGLYNMENLIDM